MAETVRSGIRRVRPYTLGVASLFLSVCSGGLFLLILSLVRLNESGSTSLVSHAPGLALLAMLLILACFVSTLLALALAAAALLRSGRGRALAAAGWMIGASFLWYAGTQETVWTPFGGGPEEPADESAQYDEGSLSGEQGPPSGMKTPFEQGPSSGMGGAEPEGEGMAMETPSSP